MPKNRIKLATPSAIKQRNLLRGARPSTIVANMYNFEPDNDNAALYSNPEDFSAILRTAVVDLILKGFSTFKPGSCFADLAPVRPQDTSQYNDDYFFREQAIVVPVLITNDIEGAACETQANKMPMMVNVRKAEGDGTTCGFARKEFVRSRSILSFAHSKSRLVVLQGRRTVV